MEDEEAVKLDDGAILMDDNEVSSKVDVLVCDDAEKNVGEGKRKRLNRKQTMKRKMKKTKTQMMKMKPMKI